MVEGRTCGGCWACVDVLVGHCLVALHRVAVRAAREVVVGAGVVVSARGVVCVGSGLVGGETSVLAVEVREAVVVVGCLVAWVGQLGGVQLLIRGYLGGLLADGVGRVLVEVEEVGGEKGGHHWVADACGVHVDLLEMY